MQTGTNCLISVQKPPVTSCRNAQPGSRLGGNIRVQQARGNMAVLRLVSGLDGEPARLADRMGWTEYGGIEAFTCYRF